MATLRAIIQRVDRMKEQVPVLAKNAVNRVGRHLEARLKTRLAALRHAQEVAAVFNLKGEPRPHLWETTTHTVRKRSSGVGYYTVVGVTKRGNHINFLNPGTVARTRKMTGRKWFVPDDEIHLGNLRKLGSRLGGAGGIAGRYVWVEIMIQHGLRDPAKRRTGTGPKLDLINTLMRTEQGRCQEIVNEVFRKVWTP